MGGAGFAMNPYNPGMGMMGPGFPNEIIAQGNGLGGGGSAFGMTYNNTGMQMSPFPPNEIMAQGNGFGGGVPTFGTTYNNTGTQMSPFSLDEIMTPQGSGLGAGVPTFGTPYNNTGTQMSPYPSPIPPNEIMPYGDDYGAAFDNAGFLPNPFPPNEITPQTNMFGTSTSSASNTRHNNKGKHESLESRASQPTLFKQYWASLHPSDDGEEEDGGRTSATKPRGGKNRAAEGVRARRSVRSFEEMKAEEQRLPGNGGGGGGGFAGMGFGAPTQIEQPLQGTMSFATSAQWQQTLRDTTADAQPRVNWLGVGGTPATKSKGSKKGGTSRSASRSRGTASNSPFDDLNPSDPLLPGITYVPTSIIWTPHEIQVWKAALPQSNVLGVGGMSATESKGNKKGGTSRSASRSRGTASNSPFDDLNPSDPSFQGTMSVQPSSNGNLDDSNDLNWFYPDFQEYQDPKAALPQGNVLGEGDMSATKSKKDKKITTNQSFEWPCPY
jgi:hypothetical protein